jgi:hypothetical protein
MSDGDKPFHHERLMQVGDEAMLICRQSFLHFDPDVRTILQAEQVLYRPIYFLSIPRAKFDPCRDDNIVQMSKVARHASIMCEQNNQC